MLHRNNIFHTWFAWFAMKTAFHQLEFHNRSPWIHKLDFGNQRPTSTGNQYRPVEEKELGLKTKLHWGKQKTQRTAAASQHAFIHSANYWGGCKGYRRSNSEKGFLPSKDWRSDQGPSTVPSEVTSSHWKLCWAPPDSPSQRPRTLSFPLSPPQCCTIDNFISYWGGPGIRSSVSIKNVCFPIHVWSCW